jgi:hypothetical protein
MKISAETIPAASADAAKPNEPALWTLPFIFWGAFAAAAVAMNVMNPEMFIRQDPDSLMRLVQVRDLLAGQGWFDLVQHRLAPPDGLLMHWSRLIDAPLAGLVLLGNFFGNGEAFALAAWPLLLLLGLMTAATFIATALAGRAAAVPALILSLMFFTPLLAYLPNDVDHHNAQLTLLVIVVACAVRLRLRPLFGLAAGFGSALMLAIGLEMLPYVALVGAVLALQWAINGEGARGTALFGGAFAVAPSALHLLTSSPAAGFACDSLSWAYAAPAALAGGGLAALVPFGQRRGVPLRLLGLGILAAASAALFAAVAPECLGGPYGFVSPELKGLWLDTITEAQPIFRYMSREPVGIIATLGPPAVALAVTISRIRRNDSKTRPLWILPSVLIAAALLLSLYQVRTLPYANAVAIPVLAAWLVEIARSYGVTSLRPLRRALPVIAAFLIALPAVHLALGWAAVSGLTLASGGRIAPTERPNAPPELVANMSAAEAECLDEASAALLAQVPDGLVLSPVFYGSGVLNRSSHSVVAAPYHRGGDAIVASIRALDGSPEAARQIIKEHAVAYVAICAASQETALTRAEAPNGLLAQLMAGSTPQWLEQVHAPKPTALRLWRVIP